MNADYLQAMTPRKCVHVGVQITLAELWNDNHQSKHNNLGTCIWMLDVIELMSQVVHPKNAN